MSRRLLSILLGIYVLCATLAGQHRPDFTGTWIMDMSRSEMVAQAADIAPTTPVRLIVTQSPDQLRIERQVDGRRDVVNYSFDDPQGLPQPVGTSGQSQSGVLEAFASWKDHRLETTTVVSIKGQAVTRTETRSLDSTGSEMIVETLLVVHHGYEGSQKASNTNTVKDVYIKQREP